MSGTSSSLKVSIEYDKQHANGSYFIQEKNTDPQSRNSQCHFMSIQPSTEIDSLLAYDSFPKSHYKPSGGCGACLYNTAMITQMPYSCSMVFTWHLKARNHHGTLCLSTTSTV